MIFQLQDDHSRLAVAWLVARAETSDAAVRVLRQGGVRAYGVPQRLLTDNGASLNPTRRGRQGRGVDHVRALGVEPITGKPYKPTTHGAGTSASTPALLRRHGQAAPAPPPSPSPPGTGQAPSTASTRHRASPPEPARARYPRPGMGRHRGGPGPQTAARRPARPTGQTTQDPAPTRPGRRSAPTATRRTTIGRNGTISLAGTAYLVSSSRAGQEALITWDAHKITITDPHGEAHSPSTRGRNREPGTSPTTTPPHAPPEEDAPARPPETSPMS